MSGMTMCRPGIRKAGPRLAACALVAAASLTVSPAAAQPPGGCRIGLRGGYAVGLDDESGFGSGPGGSFSVFCPVTARLRIGGELGWEGYGDTRELGHLLLSVGSPVARFGGGRSEVSLKAGVGVSGPLAVTQAVGFQDTVHLRSGNRFDPTSGGPTFALGPRLDLRLISRLGLFIETQGRLSLLNREVVRGFQVVERPTEPVFTVPFFVGLSAIL